MAINYRPFPKDFMWGASTSAYQVEGAAEEDGKALSQQDVINRRPGVADASLASDHYHRFKEDVALMKQTVGDADFGAEEELRQARFVTGFVDIYENSFQ